VIAVFDYDYALIEEFDTSVRWLSCCLSFIFPPAAACSLICLEPCFLKKRVQWDVYSKHLCITRDGIRFVRDKRPTCCGLSFTDAGKESKTVPFDKITDCDIKEPAGSTCLCIENVLSTVNVDTASSGATSDGVTRHELTLRGLKDPHGFKKLVWAMKRSAGNPAGAALQSAPRAETMVRGDGADAETVPLILKEIRDELREQTKLLKERAAEKGSNATLL